MTATARALKFRPCPEPGGGPIRIHAQQALQQLDEPFAIGVQKAEVAGAPETFG